VRESSAHPSAARPRFFACDPLGSLILELSSGHRKRAVPISNVVLHVLRVARSSQRPLAARINSPDSSDSRYSHPRHFRCVLPSRIQFRPNERSKDPPRMTPILDDYRYCASEKRRRS
jgi:hypothetical protein